ncbi:MAG: methyl-accepting chemotaxis protein [Candidatus Sulfotelmatobacter sp.]
MASKLFLGFAAVLTMNAAIGIFCLRKLSMVHDSEHDLALRQIPSLRALTDLRASVNAHRRAQFEYLVARTESERQESEKHLRESTESVKAGQEKYGSFLTDPEEIRHFEEIKDDLVQYLTVSQEAMRFAQAPRHKARRKRAQTEPSAGDILFGEEKTALNRAVTDLQAAVASNLRLAEDANRASTALYANTRRLVGLGIVLSTCLGLALALVIGRVVVRPIQEVIVVARRIASGDLGGDAIVVSSRDEVGELAEHVNEMQRSLAEMINAVASCAQRIASASEPISLATRQQAEGAGAQYEQTTQAATAMHQLAATAKEISNQSSLAADKARQSAETASKGETAIEKMLTQIGAIAEAVGETSNRIQELGKSSEKIGQVISVIDDIAAQTNLLALNAAIEAARAGAQGRGFAVVADEVTKLAERTTKATKEIALMIGQIQGETRNAVTSMSQGTDQAEHGVDATRQAGELLRNIIVVAQELGDMVALIATAATQQISANDHIALSLQQISKITKESAEGAQRSAGAVGDLSTLAAELQSLVNRFRPSTGSRKAEFDQAPRSPEWGRINGAQDRDHKNGSATRGLALTPAEPRRGVARIHARLLDSGTKPESQPRAPSAVPAAKPAAALQEK